MYRLPGIRDQEDRDPLPYTAAVASVDTETVDDSKPSALKRERKFSEFSPPRTAAKVRSERLKPTADGIELATGKNKMLFESVKGMFVYRLERTQSFFFFFFLS